MKYLKKIASRVKKPSRQPKVEEPLLTLMQVAQESPDIRHDPAVDFRER